MRMPLKSYSDARLSTSMRTDRGPVRAMTAACAPRPRWRWSRICKLFEDGRQLPFPHIVAVRMALDSDRSFATYGQALARNEWRRALAARRQRLLGSGQAGCAGSNIRSSPINPISPSMPPSTGWRCMRSPPCNSSRPMASPAPMTWRAMPAWCSMDPSWINAAGRFVVDGLPSHSGRDRPSSFPVLPGHPLPPHPPADPDDHRLHDRPFDHPDRLGLWLCARCAVVSAADRDADRGFHRLYGAGEYRRPQAQAPLGHHLLLRPGAWLRLLMGAARLAAIRGLACASRRCFPSMWAWSWGNCSCWRCSCRC